MDLPLELDKSSGIPIYVQLEEQIRLQIRRGFLIPNQPLPTVRALAVNLNINYNTVARVYRDLQNSGILELKRGIGTFVSADPPTSKVPEDEMKPIEELASLLIKRAKRAKLDHAQLTQLIEIKWKEPP
ncbi:MAG: GntR family transcriptional regulator [Acidobacteria bacterium]|nr:GntR family transcriptional regulator [Acidobacteriota bacterium]